MKTIYSLLYLIIFISVPCFSQNQQTPNKEKFSDQLFMDNNVYYQLKKYSNNNTILIVDPNNFLTRKELTYNNKELKILVVPEKKEGFDFLIKKIIINENLAFVAMWNKDSVTALCFYPFLSEFTPGKWVFEEITTRSIK
ncbi:hypothetical protein QFZ37_002077 [Chryseobacterium ginsenosidimutans]|uniref:hypothetical protein n=1 Tax=Chryseobacterium ginsenosidimutans TaxID=687846 RepID=UPI002782DDF6|nr:hypothetical protein [Chryseobacterium ginsenosidimutans]MDQ0593708.1 hypothetical protein [Chryseobacterium ginsenosidimutans]